MTSYPPDPPDPYGNDESVERMWAVQTFEFAETHMNLLLSVDSRLLKLTENDGVIYDKFKHDFPEFDVAEISEDQLKGTNAKVRWRTFCNGFKGDVEDFNQGTLLRLNSAGDYSAENTILVTKVQFFAIEIARNRLGLNLAHRQRKGNGNETDTTKEDDASDQSADDKADKNS